MKYIELYVSKFLIVNLVQVRGDLHRGEEVRVSGNVPALGCNKPERAVPLYTSKANSSLWETRSCKYRDL